MRAPDYSHSLVNLMASIRLALGGGENGHTPLSALPAEQLRGRPVLLVVIDGLGEVLLERHPESWLTRNRATSIDSVFPTTTATAMTSIYTGAAPRQHAITGWFMWLRELGSVAAILPFRPRHGGPDFNRSGHAVEPLLGSAPLPNRLPHHSRIISPAYIIDSAFSRATGGRAERLGFDTAETFFELLHRAAEDEHPSHTLAYMPDLDTQAHVTGCESPEVDAIFYLLDKGLGDLADHCRRTGTALIVTADHGFIDTMPERSINLADHPRLADCLRIPLCGEPRTAYCYVKPDKQRQFLDYSRGELAHACEVVESRQLVAEGWFGPGETHPQLPERVGDYTLLMKENYVLSERLAYEEPFDLCGVHGGVSEAELKIPLCLQL